MISYICIHKNTYLIYDNYNFFTTCFARIRLACIQSYMAMKLSSCAYWLSQNMINTCRTVYTYLHALCEQKNAM